MDNFRRGLHFYLGASAKTSLGICIIDAGNQQSNI
jgi:hypothetical protein